jgi:hypothetical protein
MDFKIVPDLHLPEIPGFKLPNMPDLPSGKSVIRFALAYFRNSFNWSQNS